MLLRELRKVANNCCFNPKEATVEQRLLLDVGNPDYWITRAKEEILRSEAHNTGTVRHDECLDKAITLLILARTESYAKTEKRRKARIKTSKADTGLPKVKGLGSI